jgi:hypothetical protein
MLMLLRSQYVNALTAQLDLATLLVISVGMSQPTRSPVPKIIVFFGFKKSSKIFAAKLKHDLINVKNILEFCKIISNLPTFELSYSISIFLRTQKIIHSLTKDGNNHSEVLHLHGAVAQVVERVEGVAFVHQVLARRAERRLYVQREHLEAALRRLLEDRQLQHFPVQMH